MGLHLTIYKLLFLASNHLIFLGILGGTYCDHVFSAVPILAIQYTPPPASLILKDGVVQCPIADEWWNQEGNQRLLTLNPYLTLDILIEIYHLPVSRSRHLLKAKIFLIHCVAFSSMTIMSCSQLLTYIWSDAVMDLNHFALSMLSSR